MAFVLGIIPARKGSKGIPDKNITKLNGKPLLAYTIEAAQESKILNDVILSTDSQIIAECAAQYGLKTTSLRPLHLAHDRAKSSDVVIYEVQKYEEEKKNYVDVIVLLQPTAPMRTSSDIDDALELFFKTGTDSLISVFEVNNIHPATMYYLKDNGLEPVLEDGKQPIRRQEFRTVVSRNGALYIVKKEQIFKNKSFISDKTIPFIMPRERSVNIDEPYDLELAEWMMNRHV